MIKDNERFHWLIGICLGILIFCFIDDSTGFTSNLRIEASYISAVKDIGRIFVSLSVVVMTMCKHNDDRL